MFYYNIENLTETCYSGSPLQSHVMRASRSHAFPLNSPRISFEFYIGMGRYLKYLGVLFLLDFIEF